MDGVVKLGEAVGLIVWYIGYVLIVILGREYRQYMKRRRGTRLEDSGSEKIAMSKNPNGVDDDDIDADDEPVVNVTPTSSTRCPERAARAGGRGEGLTGGSAVRGHAHACTGVALKEDESERPDLVDDLQSGDDLGAALAAETNEKFRGTEWSANNGLWVRGQGGLGEWA